MFNGEKWRCGWSAGVGLHWSLVEDTRYRATFTVGRGSAGVLHTLDGGLRSGAGGYTPVRYRPRVLCYIACQTTTDNGGPAF